MILAEKVMMLRKKSGWSQEELAMKLGVSRQSVSKWESMTSVPDLDRIIKMSQMFGVSTDFLLKDELEEDFMPVQEDSYVEEALRKVSLEEANQFMALEQKMSKRIALSVFFLIISPSLLILLGGLSELKDSSITENMAGGVGLGALFFIVIGAVIPLIMNGMKREKYEYLEKVNIALEYGVQGIVEKKKEDFQGTYRNFLGAGVALCILGVVPLVIAAAFGAENLVLIISIDLLFFVEASGVFLLIWSGIIYESYQKLLQEGDFTPERKAEKKKNGPYAVIYWCTITAIYLGISFFTESWETTWIIWPSAGVFFAAVIGIVNISSASKSRN